MKTKLYHVEAWRIADHLRKRLEIYCERIEIAGSLRRLKPEVGDIELIAIPKFELDLFGQPSSVHLLDIFDFQCVGKVLKNGSKYKQVELEEGINLDLFIVTPPAQWGVLFLIRTGSADFSHKFVTQKKFGGLLPSHLSIHDGAIWNHNELIPTPEEKDVFKLAGVDYIEPEKRN